jgi:hypothetical protein
LQAGGSQRQSEMNIMVLQCWVVQLLPCCAAMQAVLAGDSSPMSNGAVLAV